MPKIYITLADGKIRNAYTDVLGLELKLIDLDSAKYDGNVEKETMRNNTQMLNEYDNGLLEDVVLPDWCEY